MPPKVGDCLIYPQNKSFRNINKNPMDETWSTIMCIKYLSWAGHWDSVQPQTEMSTGGLWESFQVFSKESLDIHNVAKYIVHAIEMRKRNVILSKLLPKKDHRLQFEVTERNTIKTVQWIQHTCLSSSSDIITSNGTHIVSSVFCWFRAFTKKNWAITLVHSIFIWHDKVPKKKWDL